MKNYFIAAILLIFLMTPCVAGAGLANDTIGMMHEYNSSGSVEYKTVVSGTSDVYEYKYGSYGRAYAANPEDMGISVNFF